MSFEIDCEKLDWEKSGGLIPTVIQNQQTGQVLMLGYMSKETLQKTLTEKRVTFFSRTKNRAWTKGESSGNFLSVQSISADCDSDSLLIMVTPDGPTCHTGEVSCFSNSELPQQFIFELQHLISKRRVDRPQGSYTTTLFDRGIKYIGQKVGEESVEAILAAMTGDKNEIVEEVSDLLYHLLVLLRASDLSLEEISQNLKDRHQR